MPNCVFAILGRKEGLKNKYSISLCLWNIHKWRNFLSLYPIVTLFTNKALGLPSRNPWTPPLRLWGVLWTTPNLTSKPICYKIKVFIYFFCRDGRLRVGDELINVCGKRLRGLDIEEAIRTLKQSTRYFTSTVNKLAHFKSNKFD